MALTLKELQRTLNAEKYDLTRHGIVFDTGDELIGICSVRLDTENKQVVLVGDEVPKDTQEYPTTE